MVSTNDSSLEPSFFHLHQYPINDEEANENSNENEIKSFFLNASKRNEEYHKSSSAVS